MDFSFLDKPEYSDIPIYNVTKDQRENPQVHITKYVPRIDKKTHRHRGLQINYIYEGKATHIINGFEFEYKRGDISVILPFIPHILLPSREKTQIIELEFLP
jgi:quercetin dioxygenase-like cupin family protein